MVKKTLDVLSILAAAVVMVIIIYSSSSLLEGRFYEEDVQTSWDDITESFVRWEYAELALEQDQLGSVDIEKSADRLFISNVSGPVTVTPWDRDYTRIEYDRTAVSSYYQDDVYAEMRMHNSNIEVTTHYRPNAPGVTGAVGYHVYLAKGTRQIDIHTVSGEISLEQLPDDAKVSISMVSSRVTVDGGSSLRIKGYSGEVDFSLHGGSAKIDVYSSSVQGAFEQFFENQELSVKSVTGNINVTFPEDLNNVEYQVRTSSGTISLSPVLAQFRREGMLNEARGVVGSPDNRIMLETSSGHIKLRLAGDDRDLMDLEEFHVEDEDNPSPEDPE